jgi:hypothetical protein
LQLAVPARDANETPAIAAAEARVPRQLSAEETASDVAITPVAGADKPSWRLGWRGPSAGDLFAEPPDLFFIQTKREGDDFIVTIADHPKDASLADIPVRFTLTGPQPIEFVLHLDAGAATP